VERVLTHRSVMATRGPHITNVFQVLDLSIFGIFSPIQGNADHSDTVYQITDRMVKIVRAIQGLRNAPNIQAAFPKAGFESAPVSGPAFGTFHEGSPRASDGFHETRNIAFPMENLNRRRRESSFGINNTIFLPKTASK
jgi:hypothetical protein